jgi:hypothetical protein
MGYGVKVTDGSACHVRFEIREWVISLAIFQTLSGTVAHGTQVFFNMGFNDDDDDFLRQFGLNTCFKADGRASENKYTCFSESATKPSKLSVAETYIAETRGDHFCYQYQRSPFHPVPSTKTTSNSAEKTQTNRNESSYDADKWGVRSGGGDRIQQCNQRNPRYNSRRANSNSVLSPPYKRTSSFV